MSLKGDVKFQKTLALAASASNEFEAEAAEFAARRIMAEYNIDPTDIPNGSLYNRINFADNPLLKRLRAEWREQHPAIVPVPIVSAPARIRINDGLTTSIPFSINGFRKAARRQRGREQAVQLARTDHDMIRVLLNEGHGLKEIAAITGIKATTVNSTRAYHIRSRKWVKDSVGLFQWADSQTPGAGPDEPATDCGELGAEPIHIVPVVEEHLAVERSVDLAGSVREIDPTAREAEGGADGTGELKPVSVGEIVEQHDRRGGVPDLEFVDHLTDELDQ